MNILITGATGFIASHTIVELQKSGHNIIGVDNLSNSSADIVDKIATITGKKIDFYPVDICDCSALKSVLNGKEIDCCMHFAGLKAVGESVAKPIEYYDNNIGGTITLLKVLKEIGCCNLIFSSSATVYGTPEFIPITEECPKGICTNPYGWTKSMIEQILLDMQNADKSWNVVILRYFNPIGAHPSGIIGENPNGIPNNLMPRIIDAALGKTDGITVFGTDYPTKDGTGVRDYIHVIDLAKGHIKALKKLDRGSKIYNLGTGKGYSVYELINTFNKVNNLNVKSIICERRKGDIAECFADPTKSFNELNWKAELDIEKMCESAWEYAKKQKDQS